MRDAPWENFEPTPHYTYFGHVASSSTADAVGFVLVRIGSGRVPCRGCDNDASDSYDGHVYLEAGLPKGGVAVQYFQGNASTPIAHCFTSKNGLHSLMLEPGHYRYRYVSDLGLPIDGQATWHSVEVKPLRLVPWESVDETGNVTATQEREIAYIYEELICDWHSDDGEPWNWVDVEEVITRVCKKISSTPGARLRRVSFAEFSRPEFMKSLRMRGVPVFDTKWRDMAFAAAYRNLATVVRSGFYTHKKHTRADYQVRQAKFADGEKRVEGELVPQLYLAHARAAAVYFATTMGSLQRTGTAGIYSPSLNGSMGTRGRLPAFMGGGRLPRQSEHERNL